MSFSRIFEPSFYYPVPESLMVIFGGAFVAVTGRGWLFPTEKAYTLKSQKGNTLSYLQIMRNLLLHQKKQMLIEFVKTGFGQTVGKAFATMGVVNFINFTYPDLAPFQKGLLGAAIGTFPETLATWHREYLKTWTFLKKDQTPPSIRRPYFNKAQCHAFAATSVRVFYTGTTTLCAIYFAQEKAKEIFPNMDEDVLKGASAAAASFGVQIPNMPAINYQTRVLKDPHAGFCKTLSGFFREHTAKQLVQGCLMRGVNRAGFYGYSFFTSNVFNRWVKQADITPKVKNLAERTDLSDDINSFVLST